MEDTLQQNQDQQTTQSSSADSINTPTSDAVSQRTKEQFEKLTGSNQALNQENERLRRELESLKKPQPAPMPQPTVQESIQTAQSAGVDPSSYVEVDPKTGERYVNENKLNDVIKDLQSKTMRAEQTIQNYIKTTNEERVQKQREAAFKSYPELEPGTEKFDKDFYLNVKATLRDSMFNPDDYGKIFTLKEAADYVRDRIKPSVKQETKQEDQGNPKVEAGAQAPSQTAKAQPQVDPEELSVLRMATRKGNMQALAQRLLATDHVLKDK